MRFENQMNHAEILRWFRTRCTLIYISLLQTTSIYTQDIFINAFTFESVENTNTMKNKKYHTVTSEQFQNPIKTS